MNAVVESRRAVRAVLMFGVLFFAVVVLRTAWVSDDAYITLRTVDNFTNGLGLRWNVAERVQTYTHPLWMFTLSAVYFFTQEAFYTTIAVSLIVSVLAVGVLVLGGTRSLYWGWLALVALILSQAFIDYSTSGLENPMTHLLLGLYIVVLLHGKRSFARLIVLGFIASLGMVNRMDTALIFAPALIVAWWEGPRLTGVLALALGFVPFLAWEMFSLVYYGFFVPNTAFAKLGTGLSTMQLLTQGIYYLENAIGREPLTVLVMAAGVVVAVVRMNARAMALGAGAAAYILYVIYIGGDFMSGRFFTAPFFVAVALLTCFTEEERARWRSRVSGWGARMAPVGAAVVLLLLMAWLGLGMPLPAWADSEKLWARTTPTVFSNEDYGNDLSGFKDPHGIADERRFYYRDSGLLRYTRAGTLPRSRFVQEGKAFRAVGEPIVRRAGSVGYRGYFAGPQVHLLDYYALGDPLLARLPALYSPEWRIGHFTRFVPEGYEATAKALQDEPPDYSDHASVLGGMPWQWPLWGVVWASLVDSEDSDLAAWPLPQNQIADEKLRRYYDQIALVTRGPLFSRARWKAIVKLNTGQYDFLLDFDAHRYAGMTKLSFNEAGAIAQQGLTFGNRGLELDLANMFHDDALSVTLDGNDIYRLLLVRQGEVVAEQSVGPSASAARGSATYTIQLTPDLAAAGYDAVRVFPVSGDKIFRLFALELGNPVPGLAHNPPTR